MPNITTGPKTKAWIWLIITTNKPHPLIKRR
jgi:hypothetical protein